MKIIRLSHQPDYVLAWLVIALILAGLAILTSASVVLSQEKFNSSYYFIKHQLINGLLPGILFLFIGLRINYRFWKKIALILLILSIVLLILVFFPQFGYSYGGAKRWLALGPLTIQPAEIAKLAFILYLAALLDKKKEEINNIIHGLFPFLIVVVVLTVLLMLQPDFSTLLIIVFIGFAIYFLAGAKISLIATIGAIVALISLALIKIAPYRAQRLTVFLHPEIDPQGIGYQINQALLAIGAGGLFGRGLGHSVQKFLYLPEAIGDSIFAIAAEEIGLLGTAVIIFLFLALGYRGFMIAKNAPDNFSKLLAGGIVFWIVFQAFMNISSICGLIPLTGVPLPFISYGGSSLAITLAGIGILLNISKYSHS